MTQLRLTLFDNCHSFVKEALSKVVLAESDPHQWQFAILSLVQAIELMLKERLQREHSVLIFRDVDDRKNTVTIDKAVTRLEQIAQVRFSREDLDALKMASRWRNLVVHYEFEFPLEALKSVFAKLLGFVSHFHQTQFEESIRGYVPDELWRQSIAIDDYGREINTRAQLQIQEEAIDPELVWFCESCGWDTFVVQDSINTCYVCGNHREVTDCEDCGEPYYEDETKEIYVGNAKGLDAWIKVCNRCYVRREEDLDRLNWLY